MQDLAKGGTSEKLLTEHMISLEAVWVCTTCYACVRVCPVGKSQFNQIVTTDPHSLNTLRNGYPQYGGKWPVHHYTNLLLQLFESGKLQVNNSLSHYSATYHDPCCLGRYNGGYNAPRQLIQMMDISLTEMPRNKENSYCCGAGGGQIWMDSTPDGERPAENRIIKALAALTATNGATASANKVLFIVSCPKDVVMYTDAVKTTGNEDKIAVRDIIELEEGKMYYLVPCPFCGLKFGYCSNVVREIAFHTF
ncbi:Fe-S oxidoreductase [hydrothermal vent metagenome]|uniref:Fe-S oxidoreductase n=1 Tax=hydrothermal vent metagenome TaxID=652676 RepID=A0A3B0VEK6_9ZZZZ